MSAVIDFTIFCQQIYWQNISKPVGAYAAYVRINWPTHMIRVLLAHRQKLYSSELARSGSLLKLVAVSGL